MEIPEHLIAATRLGVAQELGQALVVSVFDGQRHLYIAEPRATVWFKHPVWVDRHPPRWDTYLERFVQTDEPLRKMSRRLWLVVEWCGSQDEGQRPLDLHAAVSLGVPVLTWPGERLSHIVAWPDRLLDLPDGAYVALDGPDGPYEAAGTAPYRG